MLVLDMLVLRSKYRSQMAKSMLFLLIAFGGSWALAFSYFELFGTAYSWAFAVMGSLYMFVPALAACIVQKAYGEGSLILGSQTANQVAD